MTPCLAEYRRHIHILSPRLVAMSKTDRSLAAIARGLLTVLYEQGFGYILPSIEEGDYPFGRLSQQVACLSHATDLPQSVTITWCWELYQSKCNPELSNTNQAHLVRLLNPPGSVPNPHAVDPIITIPQLLALRSPNLWVESVTHAPLIDADLLQAYRLMSYYSPRISREICNEVPEILTAFLGRTRDQRAAHSNTAALLTCYYLRLTIMKLQLHKQSSVLHRAINALGDLLTFLTKDVFTCLSSDDQLVTPMSHVQAPISDAPKAKDQHVVF